MTIRTVNGLYKLVIKLAKGRAKHGYEFVFFEGKNRNLCIDTQTSDSFYLVHNSINEYGVEHWMYGQLIKKWILE